MRPSAEKILSVLVELYAKQMGVKVKYEIVTKEGKKDGISSTIGVRHTSRAV